MMIRDAQSNIIVESIFIYPVKSLAGISLKSSPVTPRGLLYDRSFMLTTGDNRFITQRTHPQLTSFAVAIEGSIMRISHPAGGSVEVSTHIPESATKTAVVWDDSVEVTSISAQADQFFSDFLGEPIHLVGMPDTSHRQVDTRYGRAGDSVSFADGYPILVLGSASIGELNTRTTEPVPLNRFRANIVLKGSAAWEEDEWTTARMGDIQLNLVKRCERCIVIRTDQTTGERRDEPIATLKSYRRFDNKILVGMNAIPDSVKPGSSIHVGQRVDVQHRQSSQADFSG